MLKHSISLDIQSKYYYLFIFTDNQVYLTVAVDLVFSGIDEPTRFVIETKAKIFPTNERFWYFSKKALHDQFYLRLKEVRTSISLTFYCFRITINTFLLFLFSIAYFL